MAGTSFYMFWFRFIPGIFSALPDAFLCSRAFRLLFCSFGCSLFCRLCGFAELNYTNFNGNGNECDGCVSVRYNLLFISLLLFTKVHKSTTHISNAHQFCLFERTWTFRRPIFKISFAEFWNRLTYSVWEFWDYKLKQTEWIQLLARFVDWILSLFLIDVVFGVIAAQLSCFCYLGSERLPALSIMFVRLPSLCLEFCLSFVIYLNISLPFIQLLLFEHDTFVFYLNSH